MNKQFKKLPKVQMGPRTIKCPVCGKYTARITSAVNSSGGTRRKLICYSANCRMEKNV